MTAMHYRKLLALALLWLRLVTHAAPPSVRITVTPSLPEANLLSNSGIVDADAGQPKAWEFTTAQPANFETGRADVGRTDPGSLHIVTHTGAMSGYWGQPVAVASGAHLMVQARVRMTGGKFLLWLTGSPLGADGVRGRFDERYEAQSMKTFFLAPTWIRREYLRGPDPEQWFLVHKAITIPAGMNTLSVKLGSYFASGDMWIDDVYCGPARVDVRMDVAAASQAAGDAIVRVEVISIPGPVTVKDFPGLGGVPEWSGRADDLDASLDLLVRATTAGGSRSVVRVFPHPRGIK